MWTGSRRRRVCAAIAVVAAIAVIAGCSDDDEPAAVTTTTDAPADPLESYQRVGPFPVLVTAATSNGTLTSSLPIAPGSVLVGPVFPDGEGEGGFDAQLLVVGDPMTVYNAYLDAAGALGMRAGGSGGCLHSADAITCARRVVDPADGEALTVVVARHPAQGGYVSHGALRYEPPGSVDPEDAGEVRPSPPTSTPPVVTLPVQVEAPSSADWARSVSPGGPELRLADGTALAAPPGPCPCGGNGWAAVQRVEGSAEDAIDDYAAQLGVDDPEVREGKGDGDVLIADLGLVPGGITQIRAVTDDRGTWLLFAVGLG